MTSSCLRVFVADRQPVFRAGVLRTLCSQEGIASAGEAGTPDELVGGICALKPAVAIVDGSLLDRVLMARLACAAAGTRLLVVVPSWSAPFVGLLVEGLVTNCILRSCGCDELIDAVRLVGSGQPVRHDAVDQYIRGGAPGALNVNELSILSLAAEGHSNVTIARELKVTLSFVNAQVRRVLQKLNARDRTHAVAVGLKHGLLDI